MRLLRFGLSAFGVMLFLAAGFALVAAFLFKAAVIGALAWSDRLLAPLFFALVVVLVLRQLIIWIERRQGRANG